MFDTRGSGGPGPVPPPPPEPKGTGVPVWRLNPPTVPGLYWFQLRTDKVYPPTGSTRYCRVILFNGELIDARTHRGTDNLQRWWAGPLLEPE